MIVARIIWIMICATTKKSSKSGGSRSSHREAAQRGALLPITAKPPIYKPKRPLWLSAGTAHPVLMMAGQTP